MVGPLFLGPELGLYQTPDLDKLGIQKFFLSQQIFSIWQHPHYPSFECIDNDPSLTTNFSGDWHIQSRIAHLVWWLKSLSLSQISVLHHVPLGLSHCLPNFFSCGQNHESATNLRQH